MPDELTPSDLYRYPTIRRLAEINRAVHGIDDDETSYQFGETPCYNQFPKVKCLK